MKIIRFFDEQDRPCYGHSYSDGNAILLEGELFGEFSDTGNRVRVKKILAPLEPAAIFGIALNYKQHADEAGFEKPKYPILFFKNPASVNHPGDPIPETPSSSRNAVKTFPRLTGRPNWPW
jgi:2-keto-4-pentenoate hydratase/2-oxohepta-3-ene-1,7-dioic acid hydratase in catechol pathway